MNRSLLTLLLSALLASALSGCPARERPTPRPSTGTLELVRGGVKVGQTTSALATSRGGRVPVDAIVRSEAHSRSMFRHDRGVFVLVDGATELQPKIDRVTLRGGRLFVDARGANGVTLETPHVRVRLDDVSLSVSVGGPRTELYVASGELSYEAHESGEASRGETLVFGARSVDVSPEAVFEDWTGGLATPQRRLAGDHAYVGAMESRTPALVGEVGEPMSLRAHEVSVRVDGDVVETTTDQTFFNGASELVDGDYRVRTPDGSVVRGFAVDRGAGFEESTVFPLLGETGPAVVHSARLAYDGANAYRARVVGVAPGQSVRVRMVTTQLLARRHGVRTLVVPLADEGASPLVGELAIRVDATRAGAKTVTAGHGAEVVSKVVTFRASDVSPRADFVVELFDEEPRNEVVAHEESRAAPGGRTERYVSLDLPTDALLDISDAAPSPLELLVVLDTSGGIDGEHLEVARATIEALLSQLGPNDRLAVRAADVHLRALPGVNPNPAPLDASARERLLDAVATVETGGATDLGTVLREAALALAGRPSGLVLYLGDAIPTDGALDATGIADEIALVDAPPRFYGIGVGDDSNAALLRALFGNRSGVVRSRDEAMHRMLEILVAAGQPVLHDVSAELGPTLSSVERPLDRVVPVGSNAVVLGRVLGALPTHVVVRARHGTRSFERRFPVRRATGGLGVGVAQHWAASKLSRLLDEDAGREAVAELGLSYGLVTPQTSRGVGPALVTPCPRWSSLEEAHDGPLSGLARAIAQLGREADLDAGHRRYASTEVDVASALESTFSARPDDGRPVAGDGGLAAISVTRTLLAGAGGPRACFERRLTSRPDLAGEVRVRVSVDPQGRVTAVTLVRSTLGDADVGACVLDEVRGLGFPSQLTSAVTIEHSFQFSVPHRRIGTLHRCSLASERSLVVRRRLFAERIAATRGVAAMLELYRTAQGACELPDWVSQRALATMALESLPTLAERLQFYAAFADDVVLAPYLRTAILRRIRSPYELEQAKVALGVLPALDWRVFERAFRGATSPEAKLALVRRWLEAAPEDLELTLRFLSLLEATNQGPEARRVARALSAHPLADARVRTEVGEFYLRARDEANALRSFSEIVERAPLDPWARRRLGDLFLAHGFVEAAEREYRLLARLSPGDATAILLLARAAAADGRIDEALRLEQRLSEEADDEVDEGVAAVARASSTMRLARLRAETVDPAARTLVDARVRSTGILRSPPELAVTLVFQHPDDRLALEWASPSATALEPFVPATVSSPDLGLEAFRLAYREPGTYRLRVTRRDQGSLRPARATLVVTEALGTPRERTRVTELELAPGAVPRELTIAPL